MEPWVLQLLVGGLGWAILVFLVAVGVFLACRWLLLWYFRVNEAVGQLVDAAASLRAIHALLREERAPSVPSDAEGGAPAGAQPGSATAKPGLSEAEARALARLPQGQPARAA